MSNDFEIKPCWTKLWARQGDSEIFSYQGKVEPSHICILLKPHTLILLIQDDTNDTKLKKIFIGLGPVVQSIVSLTSSLRGQLVKCFMTLLPNTLIFFVEKMSKSFSHFFNKKYWQI